MLAKRIIPCLDVTGGRVVKGVNFNELRDAGDPVEIARRYDGQGADEITFLDITASSDNRDLILPIIEAVASTVFIPLTVGGGVNWQSEFFGNVFQPEPNDPVNFGHSSTITQQSYALVDVMARYRFNDHLSTTLNVKNLFDKTYYTGLGNFGTGFYGEPRSLQLTTRWDF